MLVDLLSEEGVKVALPWYSLSTGYNWITADSIVVSGGYMNVWECGCTVGGMFSRMLLA